MLFTGIDYLAVQHISSSTCNPYCTEYRTVASTVVLSRRVKLCTGRVKGADWVCFCRALQAT